MRNVSKGINIDKNFPIYAIENDMIISKAAEITIGFKVLLPEIFTITDTEYEIMHNTWLKAFKMLPDYTIVHKQDWFFKEKYKAPSSEEEKSFLSRSFDNHFYERPFLNHTCYLFVTKTRKGRHRMQSISSTLMGRIIPLESVDEKTLHEFADAVSQMEQIINDSDLIRLERLDADELIGTETTSGILEKHLYLNRDNTRIPREDIVFDGGNVCVGDKRVCVYSISSTENLPLNVSTDMRYDPFSTEVSDCSLSFAAPLGILLNRDHVYNQYIFIDNSDTNINELEKKAGHMHSLSLVSSKNAASEECLNLYVANALEHKLVSVKAHANVMAWSNDSNEFNTIKKEIGSAFSQFGCDKVRYNTVDGPVLFWSSLPGNEGDFPREETYYTFLENAICLFSGETNYKDSLSPFGIKMTDRLTGRPVHVDLSEIWMKKGFIQNRNKFVLGGSGTGKSFFNNHMMRHYYEQGSHIILVDIGNSYEGLCTLINKKTKGKDGIYYTYTESDPISFNPFYTDDGVYDIEKRDSLKTLIISLWKREGGELKPSEDVAVENAVSEYLKKIQEGSVKPCFNTFYEYVSKDFDVAGNLREIIEKENKEVKELFDIVDFLYVLAPFYKGGTYDYLLNSEKDLDLLNKRFIVFEIDKIKDNKVLFPVVTLVIMEAYINKMRRLQGSRKVLVLEEAWKAIAKEGMAEYVKYLYKTVRKYFGEIMVVSQEMDDIISSDIVKESIIANADVKILLDQKKNLKKFDRIQEVLGLTEKNKSQIFSINRDYQKGRGKYREVWFGFGNSHSAVYATEVSLEENLCYSTEETEKLQVQQRTKMLGGNLEQAIHQLASEKRNL